MAAPRTPCETVAMQPGAPNPWAPPPGAPPPSNPYAPPSNPYAPPQAAVGYVVPGGPFAAWLEGDLLAVQKEAPLPDVCIQCASGEIAHRKRQQFVWHPPWVILLYLLSPIIGVIVALVVQKKGFLSLPFCGACHARRRAGIALAIAAVLALLGGIFGGIALLANDEPLFGGLLLVAGLAAVIAIAITNRGRFVRSKKVDDAMIWLAKIEPRAAEAIVRAAQGPRA